MDSAGNVGSITAHDLIGLIHRMDTTLITDYRNAIDLAQTVALMGLGAAGTLEVHTLDSLFRKAYGK